MFVEQPLPSPVSAKNKSFYKMVYIQHFKGSSLITMVEGGCGVREAQGSHAGYDATGRRTACHSLSFHHTGMSGVEPSHVILEASGIGRANMHHLCGNDTLW